jgi:hypothetical protein
MSVDMESMQDKDREVITQLAWHLGCVMGTVSHILSKEDLAGLTKKGVTVSDLQNFQAAAKKIAESFYR